MEQALTLAPLLACPRCDRKPLDTSEQGLHCAGCRIDFPLLEEIPWLFAEPAATLAEWRGRVDFSLQTLRQEHRQLSAAAKAEDIGELTRRRLTALADATEDHAARLDALLAPLRFETRVANYASHLAFRTRLPSDQGLMTYAYNIHRDWSWGQEENEASFGIVRDALRGASPGKTLVLGAGAGRLAYDLHMRTDSTATVVLDFNPFLLLLAQRITRGETVELYEFPLAPMNIEQHAVLRTLSAEAPCREGLHYILADAHRPPFAKGSFDTIVTPWLVDILPERFEHLCRRINSLLADNGRWINFGSLSFHTADPTLRYSTEECAEIISASGFDTPAMTNTAMPYLCSPASRHGRREQVLGWSAIKQRSVPAPPRHEALPDWIVRGKQPVPLLESFQQQAGSVRIRAFAMSLIDGRRSLQDMAQVLVNQNLMSYEEAEGAIRGSLIKMYEASRRR
jgi:uncharacterized protein YbaR (Trm112 family)